MLCGAEHTKISTLSYCHLSTQQNHFQGTKSCVKDQCKSWYHCHTKALHSSHTPQTENTAGPTSSAAAAISWYLMLVSNAYEIHFINPWNSLPSSATLFCFTSDSAQEQQWSPFVDINRYNSLISLWKKKNAWACSLPKSWNHNWKFMGLPNIIPRKKLLWPSWRLQYYK